MTESKDEKDPPENESEAGTVMNAPDTADTPDAPVKAGATAGEDASNRRQFERVGVSFALLVRDGTRRIGTIEDISAGGMRVRLDDEIGENQDVREWTGSKGADNKEYTLQTLVGDEFTLTIHYLAVTMGTVKARLIRVIRIMKQLFFAMQFTEADPVTVQRIMVLVKRRSSS